MVRADFVIVRTSHRPRTYGHMYRFGLKLVGPGGSLGGEI